MASREFSKLQRNTAALQKQFLDFSKRTNGNYTLRELTQCRAFIAFVHAEIEHYLEILAMKVLKRAESWWDKNERTSKVITGLLAYRSNMSRNLPENPHEQGKKSRLGYLIKQSIHSHRNSISRNHGVKPKNISELFLPLGLDPDKIEETLIIQLADFGKRRGDLVHSSSQVSLPKVRDPFDDELSDVEFLLEELEKFDSVVKLLK